MSDTPDTPRRTVRRRNKPKKYGDFLDTLPVKRHVQEDTSSDEDDNCIDETASLKPTALFSNDDVEGQDMFKFKSRHTKHDLQNKVRDLQSNSPRIESPLKTPRKNVHLDSIKEITEATPKNVKKRIVKEVDSGSDEDDFSGSSSDFVPDESENEASSATSSSASEVEDENEAAVENKLAGKIQGGKDRGKLRPKDSEYIVTPDNYFMMNSSKKFNKDPGLGRVLGRSNGGSGGELMRSMEQDKPLPLNYLLAKITTSDHTLARLKNLNMNDNMDQDVDYISNEHKSKITELNQSYEQLFDKWMYILSEDFNIVLYGIGSKRSVLHQFQKQKLSEYPCIVVNGFFPSLTIKNILESIVMDLLKCSHVPANVGDVVKLIDTKLSDQDMELFLIIHNIDGTMLRNAKAQIALASLAQIKNVHMIATIDHINAPLLWDHSKLSKFRFTWWDVTTLLPYAEETSYENSLMTHRTGALQLSSLKSVHQSLTTNAKGIFNIIIQYQLDNHKQPHYQGLPFRDLYSKSREQFLVSSDIALRAQLTEFLDHKLVKMKRTYDGSENLLIPIDDTLLQQFLEQNS